MFEVRSAAVTLKRSYLSLCSGLKREPEEIAVSLNLF